LHVAEVFDFATQGVGTKQGRSSARFCRSQFQDREGNMHESLESILGDPSLGLTATDRIILIHLAQYPEGQRVEDFARLTGSRYRWVENEACKLAQTGILRRVAPNTYAINPEFEVRP